ncbi:MAG: caspase family protein [Parcubacteria group bacterium]
MKKTLLVAFALAFLLGVMGVAAQEKLDGKFDKPSKAKNVRISKKQVLSESDRKKLDSIESELKGKPAKVSAVVDPSVGGVTGVLGDAIPTGGQKYAILVGLANYPGTVNDLCVTAAKTEEDSPTAEDGLAYYCKDEDALNMKKALIREYGYEDDGEHIFIFSDADAKYDAIKSKIDELVQTKLTADDELVFFFSGHSSTGIYMDDLGNDNGDEALDEGIVIYDQAYDETDAATYVVGDEAFIWDDQIKAWFENSPTDRIFFAFDTCRAGGMNELQSDGRVLAMSSTEDQSSYTYYLGGTQTDVDVFQESEGLFAHYFVRRAMIDGLGDGSNPLSKKDPEKYDENVAMEEAFSYAYPIVKTATGNRQNPVLNDKFLNDLLLGYDLTD